MMNQQLSKTAMFVALVVAVGMTTATFAAPVTVLNSDFEAGPDNNTADDWTDFGATPVASVYYLANEGAYSGGRALSMQADDHGAYQDLGMTANAGEVWTVAFDAGFRDDFFTGSATVEVAILDGVGGTVLDADTITVTGTGSPDTVSIPFTAESVTLTAAAASTNNVVLQFTNTADSAGGAIWEKTALIDNVSVDVIPEPASLALLGLGGLMMLRRRRG